MKKMCCLLLLCLAGKTNLHAQEITFHVKITDADTMMVLCRTINSVDTINTVNGQFTIRKKTNTPEMFMVACVRNQQSINAMREGNERKVRDVRDVAPREIFFDNGTASITCKFAEFSSGKINRANHTMQDKFDEFQKRFNPLVRMARTIIDSSYSPGRTSEEKKLLTMLYNRVCQIENETAEKFATENTNNAAGAYVLYRYGRIENKNRLDSVYKLFTPQLQQTAYLKSIHEKVQALFALQPGQPTPDFILLTDKEQPFALSGTKGKYVVLDFWGSWCAPCISGMPKMKEYYAKYKDNITFVGIACKDKPDAWKDAIAKNALPWIHVLNNEKIDLAVKYNVEAYPTKILIDREGKFVKSFIGESDAFYKTLDEVVKK